jgi:hypothetical protein
MGLAAPPHIVSAASPILAASSLSYPIPDLKKTPEEISQYPHNLQGDTSRKYECVSAQNSWVRLRSMKLLLDAEFAEVRNTGPA